MKRTEPVSILLSSFVGQSWPLPSPETPGHQGFFQRKRSDFYSGTPHERTAAVEEAELFANSSNPTNTVASELPIGS